MTRRRTRTAATAAAAAAAAAAASSSLLLSLLLSTATAASRPPPQSQPDVVKVFADEFAWNDAEIPQFNNLAVDKVTGRVYVGAVNKLYQLSPNLDLSASAVTGPEEDSPLCSVLPDCPDSVERKLTNNVNKALVIDYSESRLIECGSIYQGVCTVRNLRNISDVKRNVREPVVANNATASTVAFIASGPPNSPISQASALSL